jgi:hypothetical protein
MSKWNKWKLIHKETGLSFNEYRNKNPVRSKDGRGPYTLNECKVEPVMLTSGVLAVYVVRFYEQYMFFLDNKEWRVIMTPATPLIQENADD